jgi:hypothetical protein
MMGINLGIRLKLMRILFDCGQYCGVHILPIDYYSPIPDTRKLDDKLWEKESELVGVDMKFDTQLYYLKQVFPKYKDEYNFPEKSSDPRKFQFEGAPFVSYDAEILHCMIREFEPRRVFEIGSGSTTLISANACLLNNNGGGVFVHDPFPNQKIRSGKIEGLSCVDVRKVEGIDPSHFDQLEENDILFIDSTHVVRIGGDILHLYLEVIPRLRQGVIIHVHDILLPKEYFKDWIMKEHYFWTEMYLLQAFLAFNTEFEILWCGSYMHCKYSKQELKNVFPRYDPERHFPGSIWIRRKK